MHAQRIVINKVSALVPYVFKQCVTGNDNAAVANKTA